MEWAVDPSTKLPVDVTGKVFKYVRVYTAVLDNGTFGETSTEVCGIFTTANGLKNEDGSAIDVGRTGRMTVKYGSTAASMTVTPEGQEIPVSAGTYYINASSSAENIYINGTKVTSGQAYEFQVEAGKTQFIRVITQDGMKAPRISVFKFTA